MSNLLYVCGIKKHKIKGVKILKGSKHTTYNSQQNVREKTDNSLYLYYIILFFLLFFKSFLKFIIAESLGGLPRWESIHDDEYLLLKKGAI